MEQGESSEPFARAPMTGGGESCEAKQLFASEADPRRHGERFCRWFIACCKLFYKGL
jgi:hypothetical protein